jgi:site-specific DNA-methyltransferase (adenine-specific)
VIVVYFAGMKQKPRAATQYRLFNGDCLDVLPKLNRVKCIFADPPDGIGLKYDGFDDDLTAEEYLSHLRRWLRLFVDRADVIWVSFNARWIFEMGVIFHDLLAANRHLEAKPCVQTFTFGQHSHADLGNNHRPLWRLMRKGTTLYPDAIRVPSWRQENGDRRADPRGRVPGDVFDFTRVVGNSKQRRPWHPTQLNEGLVEQCIKFTTCEGETVLDPFGGTGTTLRVCRRINRPCTLIELSPEYCGRIADEHGLDIILPQRLAPNLPRPMGRNGSRYSRRQE